MASGKGPWIGVKVEDEAELPRVATGPVSYALFAQKAKVADGLAAPIAADQLADGAGTSAKVGFAYAGSASKGGLAQEALKAKSAELASAALKAEESKAANIAYKLECTGCVLADMVEKGAPAKWVTAGTLHKVSISGKFSDLDGGPDLKPYARVDAAQAFAEPQTFAKGLALAGNADFAKQQALLFRVHNSHGAAAVCDAAMEGGIYYDTKQKRFFGCNGKSWVAFTAGVNSQGNPAASCLALLQSGEGKVSGLYWLQPPKAAAPKQIWCEQEKAGGAWSDLRAACSKNNNDLSEQAFGLVPGFTKANGNWKLLGAANNGKAYPVDKNTNSQGNIKIWVDNELNTENSGHYLCATYNGGSNGTTQLSMCYKYFLNNDDSQDMGDSIVAISFGSQKGDNDGWSVGFAGECGPMGGEALLDKGTVSYWIR
jgi:hypothetical protein